MIPDEAVVYNGYDSSGVEKYDAVDVEKKQISKQTLYRQFTKNKGSIQTALKHITENTDLANRFNDAVAKVAETSQSDTNSENTTESSQISTSAESKASSSQTESNASALSKDEILSIFKNYVEADLLDGRAESGLPAQWVTRKKWGDSIGFDSQDAWVSFQDDKVIYSAYACAGGEEDGSRVFLKKAYYNIKTKEHGLMQ